MKSSFGLTTGTRRAKAPIVSVLAVLALVLAGCTAEPEQANTERRELVIRLATQDMQELDPAYMGVVGSWWVGHQIYSGLVRSDTGASGPEAIRPDLAERWEISPDGLTYTFHLRRGAQWHKGYGEVKASDVKFSFERIKDTAVASPYRGLFAPITAIEAVDDYTVRLRLSKPYPALLGSVLTYRPGYIVSQAALTKLGQKPHSVNPIGSGPFVFESWQPDTEVYLSANDSYYLGAPKVSGVRMKVIQDEAAVAVALETGQIHAANVTVPEALETLSTNPDIQIYSVGSIAARYVWLNTRAGPTKDVRVRQALWHATDSKAIAEGVFEGWHEPIDTILPPSVWSHTNDVQKYPFDPARARQLLADAGFPNGFSMKLLFSQRPQDQGVALALQDMWGKVGVKLEVVGRDHPVYTKERTENRDAYDTVLVHFGRDTDPNNFVQEVFHTSQFPPGSNGSYYNAIDDLIDQGAAEPDTAKRQAIYVEIQKRLQLDVPGFPVVHTTATYALRKNVKGFEAPLHTGFAAYPLSFEG